MKIPIEGEGLMKTQVMKSLARAVVIALCAGSAADLAAQEPKPAVTAQGISRAAPGQVAAPPGPAPLNPYSLAPSPQATPSVQRSSGALIVRFSEQEPGAHMELEEDLNIMGRLLQRNFERVVGGPSPEVKMGVPILLHGPAGRSVQAVYLEGFGALFTLTVNFPLVGPAEPHGKPGGEQETVNDWEAARRDLYETRKMLDADNLAESLLQTLPHLDKSHETAQYDAKRVQALQKELLAALKNAANIRHLNADDFIAISVIGSSGDLSPWKLMSVDRRAKVAILRGAQSDNNRQMLSVPLSAIQGGTGRTILSLRARKSDVDAFGGGKLNAEDFSEKVTTRTYRAPADGEHFTRGGDRPTTLGVGMLHVGSGGEVKIVRVRPGTGAEEAGLRAGDLILEIDGGKVSSVQEVVDMIARRNPGEEARLLIRRGDEQFTVGVKLAELQ